MKQQRNLTRRDKRLCFCVYFLSASTQCLFAFDWGGITCLLEHMCLCVLLQWGRQCTEGDMQECESVSYSVCVLTCVFVRANERVCVNDGT